MRSQIAKKIEAKSLLQSEQAVTTDGQGPGGVSIFLRLTIVKTRMDANPLGSLNIEIKLQPSGI